jgi:RNA polymerase sigma-70 factor (ECF subfamily)
VNVTDTDKDIRALERVRAGDRDAFRSLVERHQEAVYSFVLRLVRSPDVAEELAQETFVRAFVSLQSFRGASRFRTWVIQIALNLVRDRRRTTGRRPVLVSLDEVKQCAERSDASVHAGATLDPELKLAHAELISRLGSALDSLPQEYREVFVLKHVEGLAYEEIATITGVSIGALKVRAHRARLRLREWLGSHSTGGREHGRSTGALSGR